MIPLITKLAKDLQTSLLIFNKILEKQCMEINLKNKQYGSNQRKAVLMVNIILDRLVIKEIRHYKYIVNILTSNNRC